jgi:DGQHR domain-containing protein
MEFAWRLDEHADGTAKLVIDPNAKVFAQVDCQHRLGFLSETDIPLAFMSFIRLNVEEEREIFTTINSKAKGLSGSLIDANAAKLADDLGAQAPDLYVATRLADDHDSPWVDRLKKGGTTLGLKKPVSLRMMRHASERFIRELKAQRLFTVGMAADAAKKFWRAVATIYSDAWGEPRRHYIAKGVGVYSLMGLAGQLTSEALNKNLDITEAYFAGVLSDHLANMDWRRGGPLESFNGGKGAEQALQFLRKQMEVTAAEKRR